MTLVFSFVYYWAIICWLSIYEFYLSLLLVYQQNFGCGKWNVCCNWEKFVSIFLSLSTDGYLDKNRTLFCR